MIKHDKVIISSFRNLFLCSMWMICLFAFASCKLDKKDTGLMPTSNEINAATMPPEGYKDTYQVPKTGGASPTNVVNPTSTEKLRPIIDLSPWVDYVDMPFAIIKVISIGDEVINNFSFASGYTDYIRAECEVLFAHRSDKYFKINTDEGEFVDIYITTNVKDDFYKAEAMFIILDRKNINSKWYVFAETHRDGYSMYIPFGKSGLDMSGIKGDFYELEEMNRIIEYNNIHGFSDEVSKLMPEKPIGTGMSIDEIAHWFDSWDVAGNMCREKYGSY